MNYVYVAMVVLVLIVITIGAIQGKKAGDTAKMTSELQRQHERQLDRKVKLTRGQRFDCPACGSTSPCSRCRLRCYHDAEAD